MLSELTDLKLQAAALSLEIAQRTGEASPPGSVTLAEYARHAGLSEATVRKIERTALARAAARLLDDPDLPPHLARLASRLLSERGL